MYEDRLVIFLDILGFGSLVEEAEGSVELQQSIFDALRSLYVDKSSPHSFSTLNESRVTLEERQSVEDMMSIVNQSLMIAHPVNVTFFSDSLIVSSQAEDITASQLALTLCSKLIVRMWQDHRLLIRGGVSVGSLVHHERGPVFGPAMNQAYRLESKEAINPRVLVDERFLVAGRAPIFAGIEDLFEYDGARCYMSLATALRYTIQDSEVVMLGDLEVMRYASILTSVEEDLAGLAAKQVDDKVRSKYEWLIQESGRVKSQMPGTGRP